MKKLEIKTHYHEAVQLLLMHLDLVEGKAMENVHEGLVIDYPNDCLSQELVFWLAMAQGCGLVESYQFNTSSVTSEEFLAQSILHWIERTNKELEDDNLTMPTGRLRVLVDDIETLCKEVLKKG